MSTSEPVPKPHSLVLDEPSMGVEAEDPKAFLDLANQGLIGTGNSCCRAVQDDAALRADTRVTLDAPVPEPINAVGAATGAVSLWATPVYVADQAEQTSPEQVAQMNLRLRELIMEADTSAFAPDIIGAQKSAMGLLRWTDPAVEWLRGRILAAVQDLTRDTLGGQAEEAARYPVLAEGWAVVYHGGPCPHQHVHRGSVWSGIYYVTTGGGDGDAGQLQFIDPRPAAIARGASTGVTSVRPRPGLLVAFPSWLPHSVRATLSDVTEPGIGVAFNIAYDLEKRTA